MSLVALFDQQIDATIGIEGNYSHDPADSGGETMCGITIAEAHAYGYTGAMAALPRSLAVTIYVERYVVAPGFDLLAGIDAPLAKRLFDIGVNMGPQTASKFVQRALNVLNFGGLFGNLSVDGNLGRMSRAAISDLYAKRGDDGRSVLYGMIAAQQSVRYVEIAEANPSQESFEYGWQLNRALGGLTLAPPAAP